MSISCKQVVAVSPTVSQMLCWKLDTQMEIRRSCAPELSQTLQKGFKGKSQFPGDVPGGPARVEVFEQGLKGYTLCQVSQSLPTVITNYCTTDWWLINYRNVFLTVLEAGSPRSRPQHGWVRALFLVPATSSPLRPHMAEEAGSPGGLFYKTLIPFTRAPPSGPQHQH